MAESTDYMVDEVVKQYNKKSHCHHYILYPRIIEEIGALRGKKILDLGCGDGDFSEMLSKKGAEVIGVDNSASWKKFWEQKKSEKLRFLLEDASNLKSFSNDSFDVVVMDMVILNIAKKEKLKKIFQEVSRVLNKGGDFIFTDLHPLGLMAEKTSLERHNLLEGFSYFEDGSEFISKVKMGDGSTMEFKDIHWTIETLFKFAYETGMFMFQIKELNLIDEAPKELSKKYVVPEFILFHCKKN